MGLHCILIKFFQIYKFFVRLPLYFVVQFQLKQKAAVVTIVIALQAPLMIALKVVPAAVMVVTLVAAALQAVYQ